MSKKSFVAAWFGVVVAVGALAPTVAASPTTTPPPSTPAPAPRPAATPIVMVVNGGLQLAECEQVRPKLAALAGVAEVACKQAAADLSVTLSPGGSLAISQVDAQLAKIKSKSGGALKVNFRNLALVGKVTLVMGGNYDTTHDEALLAVLRSKRGVTSATLQAPGRLQLEVAASNPLRPLAIVKTYVTEVAKLSGGKIIPEDYIKDLVFAAAP